MTSKREINLAIVDESESFSEDRFFEARVNLDTKSNRRMFGHGFRRGWDCRSSESFSTVNYDYHEQLLAALNELHRQLVTTVMTPELLQIREVLNGILKDERRET